MKLTKEKALLLFQKLEEYCKRNKIELSPHKSIRLHRIAKIIMQRYGSVIIVNDNGNKYLCNNAKYLKKWAMGESLGNAGSPLKLTICGEIHKKYIKNRHHG